MGATFANIQLQLQEQNLDQIAVMKALLAHIEEGREYRVAEEGESFDRVIQISPIHENRWITVYDSDFEEAFTGNELALISSHLSSTFKTAAVAIKVHDSDILELDLFLSGESGNSLKLPAKSIRKSDELERAWQPLLLDHNKFSDFKKVLKHTPVFIEDSLLNISELMGWDPNASCSGIKTKSGASIDNCLEMKLCLVEIEQEMESDLPPELEFTSYQGILERYEGEDFELFYSLKNMGGKIEGLDIVIWGPFMQHQPAIMDGLVARLQTSNDGKEEPFVAGNSTDGRPILYARFDCSIAQANQGILAKKQAIHKTYEHPSHFRIWIKGTIACSVESQCSISFMPRNNVKVVISNTLDIKTSKFPELRLLYGEHTSHAIRCLEGMLNPKILFAFLVMKVTNSGKLLDLTRVSLNRWLDAVTKGTSTYRVHYSDKDDRGLYKSRYFQIGANQLNTHKRWKNMLEQWGSYPEYSLFENGEDGLGFWFSHESARFESVYKDIYVPHLLLSTTIEGCTEEELSERKRILYGILDTFAQEDLLIQGYTASWSTYPQSDGCSGNLYEMACGVMGNVTIGKNWNQTYLRGVADKMWLGPELLAKLDLPSIEPVAEIVPLSNGAGLSLRPNKSIMDLEKVLAPVLPSREQWYQWLKKR